nr:MAG TPA: hypothetical protein [Caudoviricetes sp.]DAR56854.1 MAG TPA: hypothetical protein [Caudoviricetes sp.]DAZ32637.1 MAG TPA: hypothetical protein [Caudoviricetes sp.]
MAKILSNYTAYIFGCALFLYHKGVTFRYALYFISKGV